MNSDRNEPELLQTANSESKTHHQQECSAPQIEMTNLQSHSDVTSHTLHYTAQIPTRNAAQNSEDFQTSFKLPPLIGGALSATNIGTTHQTTTLANDQAADKAAHSRPVLFITLLLTNGMREPLRLDHSYLQTRNVQLEDRDPLSLSLYQLKELILWDWKEEWELKPSSPDFVRLISMGRLLADKSTLSELGFKCNASPTIVHMSIKPAEIVDEDEGKKTTRDREHSTKTPGCRCLIM